MQITVSLASGDSPRIKAERQSRTAEQPQGGTAETVENRLSRKRRRTKFNGTSVGSGLLGPPGPWVIEIRTSILLSCLLNSYCDFSVLTMDLKSPARWSRRRLFISIFAALLIILAVVIPLAVILPRRGGHVTPSVLLSLYIYPSTNTSWLPLYDA
jgi:hypothetical protein